MKAAFSEPAVRSDLAREATLEDDSEIRQLLRRPMDGLIQVALTRDPDAAIATEFEGPRHSTVVLRDSKNELLGVGARSVTRRFYRGHSVWMGYLGQLRAKPAKVGIKRLRAGFAHLHASRQADELPFDFTAIAADNAPASRLLLRGLPGLPRYEPVGRIETLVVNCRTTRDKLAVRSATEADREAIATLLQQTGRTRSFAVDWQPEELDALPGLSLPDFAVIEDDQGLRAVGALWDQRTFKQVVIQGYARWLEVARPAVNLGLRCIGQPLLPSAGSTLPLGYLSHFALRDEHDFAAASALAKFVSGSARQKGMRQLVFALADDHPLLARLRTLLHPRLYASQICLVHWNQQSRCLPIDRRLSIEAAIL